MFKHLKLTVFGVLISTMAIGQVGVRKDVKYPEKGRSPKPESALQAESDHATLGQKPKAKSITKGTVIFSEDFSAGVMPPEFILYNWDGLTPAPNVSFVDAAWVVEPDLMDSTNYAAFSTSWYNPVGTADDWMILPKMQIPAGAILNWNAIAYDGSFADGYQVLVSTGDSATSSFTDTLFSVAGENDAWTSRSASLNDFSGQDVYIAFRNNSFDKFLLAVDDIQVYLPPPYDIGVTEVTEPNNDSNCDLTANEDVSVVIESFGSDTITNGFDVHYTINGGTPVSETISDTLLPGQLMNYTFNTKADLSVYQDYAIEAYTSYAQDNDTVNDTASTSVVSSDAQLSIRIHTDSYPSEISWELLDNNNQLSHGRLPVQSVFYSLCLTYSVVKAL
ncbi:MAG: choice-of-anchor J domain-containing protein [Bacteroidales bacterium]